MSRRHFLSGFAVALAAVIAVVGIAAAGFYLLVVEHFNVPPPEANYPPPRTLLEAQRQDLDYFGKLMALDRSYTPQARQHAERQLAELKSLDQPLPPARLKVALMQIIALADNGHSRISGTSGNPPILVEPVRIAAFSDGFYVMRAKKPYRALLGGRVTEIDGVPFDTVLTQLETLQGGTKAWRQVNAASFILVHDILYGLGIASDSKMSSWTVVRPDGHVVTAMLYSHPLAGTSLPISPRWVSPEPLKGMGKDWLSYAPATGHLPESLRDYDDHFALIKIPGSCAVDVRLQDIMDTDGQQIAPFLKTTESILKAHPPCAAIVDLRGDHGGNYANTWHFSEILPKLVAAGGPIYILTDGQTFSAAITTIAFLKDAGGERVKIVGEPVGDRLVFYSEGRRGCLPNAKICINYQLGKHDYTQPCLQRDCWWENWLYPARVRSLQPDELVASRFADWNKGHDAAYEWAVRAVQDHRANKRGDR